MLRLRRIWLRRFGFASLVTTATTAIVLAAMVGAEFDPKAFFGSGPRFVEFFSRLVPPDWSVTELILRSTFETLMIALAGTALAVMIALPIGFLAALNVVPAWLAHSVKAVLGFIRSIPLIIVALIFVAAIGLGPFTGALALAYHSIGMLGKFYSEEFETADAGILDAVEGTGASWLQKLRFGLFPQCVPQIVSFTVYRFEMNFRDAAVLGLVGAGGIGYYIQIYIRGFQYEKVAVLLLVIIGVVLLLDQMTFWVRRWAQ